MTVFFVGLFIASSGYAWLLEWLKRRYPKIEPDWTWAEVVGGTSLVLVVPLLLEYYGYVTTARESREVHWIAFVVAGLPVILWQVWRMNHRANQTLEVAQEEATNGRIHGKNSTPTLAHQSSVVLGTYRGASGGNEPPARPCHNETGESDQHAPEQS